MALSDVKILAEIATLFVVGFWAVYGFIILRKKEKASAELKNTELEMKKAELALRQIAVVKTYISSTVKKNNKTEGYYLLCEVTLTNEGKRDTRLKWHGETPPFAVRQVIFDDRGIPTYPEDPILIPVRQTVNPELEAVSHILRAGGKQTLPFAVLVQNSGVYLLSFRGVVAPEEASISVEAGTQQQNTVSWTATKYIVVEDV